MFSTQETSVHVLDKIREVSPLEREEGYGGKDLEKRWVLRREWKTLWDTPTTDLGAESGVYGNCNIFVYFWLSWKQKLLWC